MGLKVTYERIDDGGAKVTITKEYAKRWYELWRWRETDESEREIGFGVSSGATNF